MSGAGVALWCRRPRFLEGNPKPANGFGRAKKRKEKKGKEGEKEEVSLPISFPVSQESMIDVDHDDV